MSTLRVEKVSAINGEAAAWVSEEGRRGSGPFCGRGRRVSKRGKERVTFVRAPRGLHLEEYKVE